MLVMTMSDGAKAASGELDESVNASLADGRSATLIRSGRTTVLPDTTDDTSFSTRNSLQHCVRTTCLVFCTFSGDSCVPCRVVAVQYSVYCVAGDRLGIVKPPTLSWSTKSPLLPVMSTGIPLRTPCRAPQYTIALTAPLSVTANSTELRDTVVIVVVRLKFDSESVG
jgi:hypothetical protein